MAYETDTPESTQFCIDSSAGSLVRQTHVVPPTYYEDHSPVVRITTAVAEVEDRSVSELPPLAHVVDPDALNALLEDGADASVTFTYFEYEVTAEADGTIELAPHDD